MPNPIGANDVLRNFVINTKRETVNEAIYFATGIVYFYVASRETIYRMRYNLSRKHNSTTGMPKIGEWDVSRKSRPGAEGIYEYDPTPEPDIPAEIAERFTELRNAALVLL